MSAQWYCIIGDLQYGPMSADQLRGLVTQGQVNGSTMIRQGEDGQWVAAQQVRGLLTPGPPTPPVSVPPAAAPPARGASPTRVRPQPLPTAQPLTANAPATPSRVSAAAPASPSRMASLPPKPEEEEGGRRRDGLNAATIWVIVGGVVAVIAVIAVIVIALNPPSRKKATEVAARDGRDAPEIVLPEDAANTVAAKKAKPAQTNAVKSPAKPKKPNAPDFAAERQIVKAVRNWRDATRYRSIGLKNIVGVNVTAVWTGSEAEKGAKADTTTKDEVSGDDPVPSAASYVFVQLKITNKGQAPMRYRSWNGSGPDTDKMAAVLSHKNGSFLTRTPLKEVAEGRLQQQELAVGQSTIDVLVFQAPSGEFEALRLALPYEAIGKSGGSFGLELPKIMIADQPPQLAEAIPVAEAVPRVGETNNVAVGAPAEADETPPKRELTDAEKLRQARDSLQRGIEGEPEEEKPDNPFKPSVPAKPPE